MAIPKLPAIENCFPVLGSVHKPSLIVCSETGKNSSPLNCSISKPLGYKDPITLSNKETPPNFPDDACSLNFPRRFDVGLNLAVCPTPPYDSKFLKSSLPFSINALSFALIPLAPLILAAIHCLGSINPVFESYVASQASSKYLVA